MKRTIQALLGTLACAAAVGWSLTASAADVRGENVANARTHRASQLVGMSVHNTEGEKIGSIHDVVINMDNGQVSYAALGFGGVLGFGEKLFAVPFSSLKFDHNTNDTYFVLNMSKEKLKAAPGFDKSHWPDLADPNWAQDIDNYYRSADAATATTTTKVADGRRIAGMNTYRSSKLVGMHVRNTEGERVGTIDDLVINMDNGQIAYAALGFGGILGLGEKLFAVPFHQMTFEHGTNDTYFVLNVTREKLKAAPGFDKNHWPDLADPNWSQDIDKYYRQADTKTTKTVITSETTTERK